jgi:hypothetical protein
VKVIIYRSGDTKELQEKVNAWLNQLLIEVISLHYQATTVYGTEDIEYSICIQYRELLPI